MTTHEWRERDDENQVILCRARHHAGDWTFQSRPKKETEWTRYSTEDFPLPWLESFREVLWNKVQRRRSPEKHLDQIDELIEGRNGDSESEKT